MALAVHLVMLAVAVLAISLVSAFVVEADDAVALRSLPRRFVRFFAACLLLLAFAYFGPL
ncbi:MAG: hypothetical protein R3F34_12135 [Planctomycetota bacterium]